MSYIIIPAVYDRLKKAEEDFTPVVMMGPSGIGKSAAAENYYKRRNPFVIRCVKGRLEDMPDLSLIRSNVIIIEDAQWLEDSDSNRYVARLVRKSGRQIVVITRGAFPKALAFLEMDYEFVRVTERDFMFGENEVRRFYEDRGIDITEEDVVRVTGASYGYPWAVFYYAKRMESGEVFSEKLKAAVWQDLFNMWDGGIFDQFDVRFRELAVAMCQYDEFTIDMVEFITGYKGIAELLEYCRNTTSQLIYNKEGSYSFRPEQRAFFIWKQKQLWSEEKITENLRRGGYYYENTGDIPGAMKMYSKAHLNNNIRELLIRNAKLHPGIGQYIELREYYMGLSDEDIKKSPVLMAGMSMLCSLTLDVDNSMRWYNELLEYENNSHIPKELRKEARIRIAYLDIALAYKGVKGIIGIMKNTFTLMRRGDIVLPEMAATGNCPSILNGGLDFSEWTKNDVQISRFMAKPIETILGRFGKGLVTIGLAESGFEKGIMNAYEVMTRCNNGYEIASCSGRIEVCFVAVGIQVRQHIIEGQLPSARRIYNAFRDKVETEEASQLIPNLDAFGAWLDLYGNREYTTGYLEEAPDEKVFFSILDRYRSMVKLRCLIAENRLEEALELSEFLMGYFVRYDRHMYNIENELLKGIILYRTDDNERWKEHIISALKMASEYHFIRVIALEGIAVIYLLKELWNEGALEEFPEDYINQLMSETENVALAFPDYMLYVREEKVSLTRRETQVLTMLCAGLDTDTICEECGISYSALKKHNRNIYKKLGAKDRAEAERKAVQMGLVNR